MSTRRSSFARANFLSAITSNGASNLKKAFDRVRKDGPQYGLYLNEIKTILFWGNLDLDCLNIFPATLKRESVGVKLLGSGVGTPSFVDGIANKRVTKIRNLLYAARSLADRPSYGIIVNALLLRNT